MWVVKVKPHKYHWNQSVESLPTYCNRIAEHWATLACFGPYASGKVVVGRVKAKQAFNAALVGFNDDQKSQAYRDTISIVRLITNAKEL